MKPSKKDYNAFARAIVREFMTRSTGSGPDSRRIVGQIPSDRILTGFLTPVRDALSLSEGATQESVNLHEESPYEQTNIGLEWLSPVNAKGTIHVIVRASIYVRRLPERDEQRRHQGGLLHESDQDVSVLIPVWTREDLGSWDVSVDMSQLAMAGRVFHDLTPLVQERIAGIDTSRLYPVEERDLRVPSDLLADEQEYRTRMDQLEDNRIDNIWHPALDIRLLTLASDPEHHRVAVRLINRSQSVTANAQQCQDPNLYCVSLEVEMPSHLCSPSLFRELPKSYRYDRTMIAHGINCHVEWVDTDGHLTLRTACTPSLEVPRLVPREVPGAKASFEALATDPIPILERILADMRRFDEEVWQAKTSSSQLSDEERREACLDRERFRKDEISRFERGVNLLGNPKYPNVKRAFVLMNRTMERLSHAHRRFNSWRLFQIAYIVSQIPSLAAREYPELGQEGDDRVEILWFAAGGGKTEAFLGLILWEAFFDRLRGKSIGVTALVRYPLRLLTFQQLDRLLRALAAAEVVRAEESLGGARFSLGYYVGRGSTPNSISADEHQRLRKGPVPEKYRRVFECPFCGFKNVELRYNAPLRRIEHTCTSPSCPGGAAPLPVYIVDDDIYRYLPTVIVSTVDKLAQAGQNQRFSQILGRFDLFCPVHGASFLDSNGVLCSAANEPSTTYCDGAAVMRGPFHDPGPSLLVQDELHLLSEELGTFDAHYETAVMEMSRSFGHRPWKIICATATIEQYEEHAYGLYLRPSVQFPAPGPDAFRTYYFEQSPDEIGRIFIGVVGIGRKHTPAVTKVLAIMYVIIQEARELAELDPQAAAEKYGTTPLDKDAFRELINNYEVLLTYVLTRKGSDQVAEAIKTRVQHELDQESPNHGELLMATFNSGVEMSEMIMTMEEIRSADPNTDPSKRIRGIVATNIIGHGVDVDRFNIMVFAGLTRLVAEYIQASARIGRRFPGISILVATPQSERDRSVLARFVKFHEYLDRLVDPCAINRWPEAALTRTVPGILSAYLMGVAANEVRERVFRVRQVQRLASAEPTNPFSEARILEWMRSAYGVDKAPNRKSYEESLRSAVLRSYEHLMGVEDDFGSRYGKNINIELQAMQSLRDTDDPAIILVEEPKNSPEGKVIRRFLR